MCLVSSSLAPPYFLSPDDPVKLTRRPNPAWPGPSPPTTWELLKFLLQSTSDQKCWGRTLYCHLCMLREQFSRSKSFTFWYKQGKLKKGYSKALENLKILNIIFLSKAMTNLIDFLWLVNLWSLQQVMTEWNLKRWNHLFLAQCIQWIFHGLFNWLKHPTEVRPLVFTEYNVA